MVSGPDTASTSRASLDDTAPAPSIPRQYPISSMLQDPHAPPSLLPALPSLASNPYLPTSITSLGTAFTSAGTLPSSSSLSSSSSNSGAGAPPGQRGKSVAQRRSQAPPIVVSDVRKVNKSEFEAYLSEVGPAWDRWLSETRMGRDGVADLKGDAEGDEDDVDAYGRAEAHVGLGIQEGSGRAGGGGAGAPTPLRRPARRKKKEEELPPLDGVPQIFFDPAFNLSNPRTFDIVTEKIQDTPHGSPRIGGSGRDSIDSDRQSSSTTALTGAGDLPGLGPLTLADLATDQILQEKLSHYTAVIESHLVREIGLRSSSFFSALANLQHLHQRGEDALIQIAHLQAALSKDQPGVGSAAARALDILRAQARRRGLEKIEAAVRAVEEVWGGVEAVKAMVENGEWTGALDVSEHIEAAYLGSSAPSAVNEGASLGRSSGQDTDGTATNGHASSPATPTAKRRTTSSSPASRSPTLNLTRLKALDSVPRKLALLRQQVAKSLEGELIAVMEHEMDVARREYEAIARRRRRVGNEWSRWTAGRDDKGKGRALEAFVSASPHETDRQVGEEEPNPDPEPHGEERAAERAKERIRLVVGGLVRADGLESAVAAWRELALRQIRALVRTHLPSSSTNETPTAEEDDAFAQLAVKSVSRSSVDLGSISEKSISLAKRLRGMSHADFLTLARDTYLGLLACLEIVELHSRVLIELATTARQDERRRRAKQRRLTSDDSSATSSSTTTANGSSSLTVPGDSPAATARATPFSEPESPTAPAGEDAITTDISDVVHVIAELANLRFSKVIGVRTEVHAQLDLAAFLEIFDVSWTFVLQCELVCQRMIVGLRGVMVGQAKTFLQTFHQKRLTDSARFVENEQWVAVDVQPSTQAIVNLLLQGAIKDPTEFLLGARRTARLEAMDKEGQPFVEAELGEPDKQVDIDGRKYYAVSAGSTALETLADYVKVVVNCPLLTMDAMSKVVEFMKSYNSRTCQVVLGAGAMRSAGLKNITAKHLALASQALSIMISLIPYIRETIRRHLSPKQAVMLIEFDKLKRDYQEHQNEIHSKLVAIMSDRLQVHARTLETIKWEQPSPKPGAPNSYVESLVKENTTLHKVLSRFLSPETVNFIMGQVFAATDTRLIEEFDRFELKSEAAKERMLIDAGHLTSKLGELKGLSVPTPGQRLEALIEAKPLPKHARASLVKPTPMSSPALPQLPSASASSASLPRSSFEAPSTSAASSPNPASRPSMESRPSSAPTPEGASTPAIDAASSDAAPPLVPAATAVNDPAVLAPTPIVSLAESTPTAGPSATKKKTLAERLADMAKRGRGTSHQLATAASTPAPSAPATPVLPFPAPAPETEEEDAAAHSIAPTKSSDADDLDDLIRASSPSVTAASSTANGVETGASTIEPADTAKATSASDSPPALAAMHNEVKDDAPVVAADEAESVHASVTDAAGDVLERSPDVAISTNDTERQETGDSGLADDPPAPDAPAVTTDKVQDADIVSQDADTPAIEELVTEESAALSTAAAADEEVQEAQKLLSTVVDDETKPESVPTSSTTDVQDESKKGEEGTPEAAAVPSIDVEVASVDEEEESHFL